MLTDPQLKSKVDALWNRFWSGGFSNPLTAIEQMSYLIILQRPEDMDDARAASMKKMNETQYEIIDTRRKTATLTESFRRNQ